MHCERSVAATQRHPATFPHQMDTFPAAVPVDSPRVLVGCAGSALAIYNTRNVTPPGTRNSCVRARSWLGILQGGQGLYPTARPKRFYEAKTTSLFYRWSHRVELYFSPGDGGDVPTTRRCSLTIPRLEPSILRVTGRGLYSTTSPLRDIFGTAHGHHRYDADTSDGLFDARPKRLFMPWLSPRHQ